jgi:hypothetical protein
MSTLAFRPAPVDDAAVVTKAVLRAAERMGVAQNVLSRILGVSEASVSRMQAGRFTVSPGEKPYELAVLFIRLFRALDALVDGDEAAARAWLRAPNLALRDTPLTLIQSVAGLVHAVAYLDARRARI